jgi:RimJ/RimL family protein N-acetyltransferase
MGPAIINTPHLFLRPWTPADAQVLFEILQEKDLLKYFPRTAPPPYDRVEKYIARHQEHWQQFGYGHWAVIERASGKLMGWNGLEFLPDTGETEVAYLLSHNFWGRGFATEAARAALKFGFESAGLERIIGLAHPENIASRRVLEKCGLALNGRKIYWELELCHYSIDLSAWKKQSQADQFAT